ncbi:MAG: pyridoxal-phosphate dependent enzyme [Opitutaceae bacterium]|jgi:threonine dehydratase
MSEILPSHIQEAHARIRDHVHWTPVLTSARLNQLAGAEIFFKCENFQKTGAFKARGAVNAVLSLSDSEAGRGVATHSSGNHAAALAWAAGLRGIRSTVVMPSTASRVKIAAVERYGGRIVFCEPTHRAREETAEKVVRETGAVLIHPFNDPRIIAGQGTAALELVKDLPNLDVILCPLGGGGLLAGAATAAKALHPELRVFGVEPEGAADGSLSYASGERQPVAHPASVADGLLAFVGDLTFPVILRHVDGIVTVSDAAILSAMRRIFEILKVAVEPSGAVAYAAVAEKRLDLAGKRVGVILSGGNVDLERLLG